MTTVLAKYVGKKILGETATNRFGTDVSYTRLKRHGSIVNTVAGSLL